MRSILRWLRATLWPSPDPTARQHPDGGPGDWHGPYPWEKDGEALPADEPRTVVGVDLGGPQPMAVVATEQPDGTVVIDHPNLPADWPEQMRRRFGADIGEALRRPEVANAARVVDQPLRRQEWAEGGVVGAVRRPAVEPEVPRHRLRPGDPGYWEQFG